MGLEQLYIIGLTADIFFLIYLYSRRFKKESTYYLAAIVLVAFFNLLFYYATLSKLKWLIICSYFLADGSGFLFGPLLFLYVSSQYHSKGSFWRTDRLKMFLPYLTYTATISSFVLYKNYLFGTIVPDPFLIFYFFLFLIEVGYGAYFLFLAFNEIKKYKRDKPQNASWIKFIIYTFFIFYIADVIGFTVSAVDIQVGDFGLQFITVLSLVAFIVLNFLYVIKQPDGTLLLETEGSDQQALFPLKKYRNSGLTEEAASIIIENLSKAMLVRKLYLDSELSLDGLSEDLGVAAKTLSEVLNTKLNTTFNDYVNGFRVEEFQQQVRMGKCKQLTILGLAIDCGFNSKATFNRIFRKITGVSPSHFIEDWENNSKKEAHPKI